MQLQAQLDSVIALFHRNGTGAFSDHVLLLERLYQAHAQKSEVFLHVSRVACVVTVPAKEPEGPAVVRSRKMAQGTAATQQEKGRHEEPQRETPV